MSAKHLPNKRRHDAGASSKFVPLGSVDRVLLTGGKNLTMFQSVGIAVVGLCIALGVGVPILVSELSLESTFGRRVSELVLGSGFILLGLLMIANGFVGIVRKIRKAGRA
jgi:uncharacterized membrane protein